MIHTIIRKYEYNFIRQMQNYVGRFLPAYIIMYFVCTYVQQKNARHSNSILKFHKNIIITYISAHKWKFHRSRTSNCIEILGLIPQFSWNNVISFTPIVLMSQSACVWTVRNFSQLAISACVVLERQETHFRKPLRPRLPRLLSSNKDRYKCLWTLYCSTKESSTQ